MMQYRNRECNYNLKRRRELHFIKTIQSTPTLLPVYVMVVSSFFLVCSNNNKRLDTVISSSVFKILVTINLLYL